MRKLAIGVAAALAFALNPAFVACGGKTYNFTAKELNAAIAGTWKLTPRGSEKALTFTLAQRKLPVEGRAPSVFNEAAACGNRQLVATADACLDTTTMPLTVTFQGGTHKANKAEYVVTGYTFKSGNLRLEIDDLHVNAAVSPDGTVTYVQGDDFELVHTP